MWTFVKFRHVPLMRVWGELGCYRHGSYTNPEFIKFCPDRPLAIAAPLREAFP